MKIAISVNTLSTDARFEPRFGRAAAFLLVDTETGEKQALANPAGQAAGGAGVQAAEFIARQGAETVISGTFGPNAYEVLAASSIKMYCATGGSVDQVIQQLQNGQLDEFAGSSSGGRGRRGRGRW